MNRRSKIAIIALFVSVSGIYAQAQKDRTVPDSSKARPRSVALADTSGEELVLGPIEIKGKVEKPGVIIMPKRVEPDLKQIELERSFKKEVNEDVGEAIQPKKELRRVEKVKSIKKTVGKERK